ncbi:hypothetical protein [Saccharothrix sp. NRRL B-16314]|uniref:hypothetical protein n=1 Tax=Saccharothrix sp. NRRL B-16314 TaxID=1463825 RepID=UPI000AAC87BB|nr:hypothetical protein [Saccharothrix sp. NRRL B-16314]
MPAASVPVTGVLVAGLPVTGVLTTGVPSAGQPSPTTRVGLTRRPAADTQHVGR